MRIHLTATLDPPGWKPGATSAKMADATIFRHALGILNGPVSQFAVEGAVQQGLKEGFEPLPTGGLGGCQRAD